MKVNALIITGFGLNCERETAAAFEMCGASASKIHLNDLLNDPNPFERFQILTFIGGFSFGDHLGAGTVFANKVRHGLCSALSRFIDSERLVIGICNGFQTMTRLGLVPALDGDFFTQSCALAHNDCGTFRDAWVTLRADPESPCVFTKGLETLRLPVRHGEGKFVASPEIVSELERRHLIPLRYAATAGGAASGFPANPNGSINDIAAICDPSGRVFGLMPHPEAYLSPFNAPDWTREDAEGRLPAEGAGAAVFRNAVRHAEENLL